jgi:hypothetical protein
MSLRSLSPVAGPGTARSGSRIWDAWKHRFDPCTFKSRVTVQNTAKSVHCKGEGNLMRFEGALGSEQKEALVLRLKEIDVSVP